MGSTSVRRDERAMGGVERPTGRDAAPGDRRFTSHLVPAKWR